MARHDPELIKAHAANRRAIAVARQEAILAFRAEGAAKRDALAAQIVAEAKAQGRLVDIDAYTSAARKIEVEYKDREIAMFGRTAGAEDDARRESRDPVYQPGNASLRYWGRA